VTGITNDPGAARLAMGEALTIGSHETGLCDRGLFAGEVEHATDPARECLVELAASGRTLESTLDQVTSFDSAGSLARWSARQRAAARGASLQWSAPGPDPQLFPPDRLDVPYRCPHADGP